MEDRAKVVDEIGELEQALAPLAEKAARLEKLRKQARAWPEADKIAADATVAYRGKKFVLALGVREKQRKIRSLADVFKRVGRVRFLASCSLTLKALEELLPGAHEDLLTEDRTGSRSITVAKAA